MRDLRQLCYQKLVCVLWEFRLAEAEESTFMFLFFLLVLTALSFVLFCPHPGSLTVGLVQQCQTIHGRDRNCIPPQLPPEWITTLFFIILGIISLTVTCGLMVMSRWRREATRYARWIAFTGSRCSLSPLILFQSSS